MTYFKMNPITKIMRTVWKFVENVRGHGTILIVMSKDPSFVNYTVGTCKLCNAPILLDIYRKELNKPSIN